MLVRISRGAAMTGGDTFGDVVAASGTFGPACPCMSLHWFGTLTMSWAASRGHSADADRQEKSRPILEALEPWLRAIRYGL
jgi:hypothetical protein